MKNALVALVLCTFAFSIYTVAIMAAHGPVGFIGLALEGGWGGQMFLDLVIALCLFSVFMWEDARANGIPPLPYGALLLATGSIGALLYLIHRTAKQVQRASRTA